MLLDRLRKHFRPSWLLILFVVYSLLLLAGIFDTQRTVRASAVLETTLRAQQQANTFTDFLATRRADAQELAASPEVFNYFTNRALGMSLKYGLASNLFNIEMAFGRMLARSTTPDGPIYHALLLVDEAGGLLAAAGKTIDSSPPAPGQLGQEPGKAYTITGHAPPGLILTSAPVHFKDQLVGHILAYMNVASLRRYAGGGSEPEARHEALVDGDGRPVFGALPRGEGRRIDRGLLQGIPHGGNRQLEGYGNGGALLVKWDLAQTPYHLLTLVPLDTLYGRALPTGILIAVGIVPIFVVAAYWLTLRTRRAHQELQDRFAVVDRKRSELAHKYTALELEIQRREAVEAELRSKGSELEQKTQALQAAMAEVSQLARYDSLTGLGNRNLFLDNLHQAIQRARREGHKLAVMFIDLDRFKRINDTLGHSAGDSLLREIAQRVLHCIRETDTIARESSADEPFCVSRQGGDEFTLLLNELHDDLPLAHLAQRIIQSIVRPMMLGGHEVVVTCSIGISVYPEDGEDEDALLKNADAAMYTAKENGRNQYQFFEPAMQARAMRRLELENDLLQALDKGQMQVHYQPLVHTGDRVVVAYEALIRWEHPAKGMIPPSEFIPLAEESGQIIPLTNFVLSTAAQQAREWHRLHGHTPRIAVNLSGRILDLVDVPHMARMALRNGPENVNWLELELTESSVMQRHTAVMQVLQTLRAQGIRISIDDFGTGYSSLAYLKVFAIDTLKIDRSFVIDLPGDMNSSAIVRAIIAMAHTLDMEVVAEGVEDATQFHYLAAAGCDLIQGYYIAKPLPANKISNPTLPARLS
jgi:diguanylate cyclase (GGDEF)-like protein